MSDAINNAIEVLNRIHQSDSRVLPRLIGYRIGCNAVLAADPTVQVGKTPLGWEVGLLGIINGLFGINANGSGWITAVFDDDGNLLRFQRTSTLQEATCQIAAAHCLTCDHPADGPCHYKEVSE